MQSQSEAFPEARHTYNSAGWECDANQVIQELVDSDRVAQEYHAHLELRLKEEHSALGRERQRSAHLESQVSNLQFSRHQMEHVVSRAIADAGELRRQLDDLRKKSANAECRIISLSTLNDSLLNILFNIAAPKAASQDQSMYTCLNMELCRQQQIVQNLQQTTRQHAESIQSLKDDIDATEWIGSFCEPGCGGDGRHCSDSSSPETIVAGGQDIHQENAQQGWNIFQ
ncbi:uncharacterized protein BDV14DRAFT_182310 [Aspergillus stella-maris]|uniref:uncharacterized protein n=1 Tax=Aspergillus stella-maris TaxID=1810926 RepID=UPI003CCC8F2D